MTDYKAIVDGIRAEERERCAKVCEKIEVKYHDRARTSMSRFGHLFQHMGEGAGECAEAIRAIKD